MTKVAIQIANYQLFFGKNVKMHKKHLLISDLARFICYKIAYKNSRIYNYSPNKVAKQGRCYFKSKNTIDKHIKKFIAMGWAEMQGTTLVLAPKAALGVGRIKHIKMKAFPTFKSIKKTLFEHVFFSKLNQQSYAKNKAALKDYIEEESKKSTWAEYSRPENLIPKFKYEHLLYGDKVEIGLKGTKKFFGYASITSARKWCVPTETTLYKRYVPKKTIVGHINKGEYTKSNQFFTKKGVVFEQPCAIYLIEGVVPNRLGRHSK